MPYHYSFKNESLARSFYSKVDSVIDNKSNINEIEEIINELEELYDVKGFGIVSDLKIIKSDFLIDNIDRSFDLWQKGRWAKHMNFEQFCEYILPYKSEECQFLDNWREYLKDEYNDNLQNLEYCDSYKNSSLRSALVVNDNIRKKLKPMVLYYSHSPIRLLSTKQRMPYGICDDYTNLTVSIFRSIGIPIVYDYTPQWPFRSIGHAWNAVLCNNGKNVTFCGGGTTPGQIASYYDKMAKVYRKTYSANMDVLELKKKEKFVPDVFETPFMKDVTEEYMACRDIEIDALKTDRKYYYISVFNDNNWVPVDFAKPDGRKIKFESLGTDIVYLPVYYNDNGRLESFTDPVLLKPDGMRLLTPDTINKQTLILKRKYPVFVDVYSVAQR